MAVRLGSPAQAANAPRRARKRRAEWWRRSARTAGRHEGQRRRGVLIIVKREPERLARRRQVARGLPVVVIVAHARNGGCLKCEHGLRVVQPPGFPLSTLRRMRVVLATAEQVKLVLGRVASAPEHRTGQWSSIREERVLAFAVGCDGCRDATEVASKCAEDNGIASVAERSRRRDLLQQLAESGQQQLVLAVIVKQPLVLWRPLGPAQGITHLLKERAVDDSW
eukprot:scaffold23061_cov116-Isochrysis_galbana.AAC.7